MRRFTNEPVGEAQLQTLLEAAMAAPSAGNKRPWHFVVVRDRPTLTEISESQLYATMIAQAPLCIVPCGQPSLSFDTVPDFWIQDVSAATESLLLAATGLGLGAVWCGVFPVEERVTRSRAILGIPDDVTPLCYVPIGHPAQAPAARTQYDPERVHIGRW